MARHAPHRCRIARNPTPVHSALGERLTYRLLQVQRSLSKESQTSAVTWPPQPDNSASRDDQPRPRSLTTTSHPRVSGVLRYAGDLQHRSGQPAHQYRVHGAAGSGRALFDGRSRSLSGQCVHQAVFIKRLWRSLKYEAVYLRQLADGFMAQRVIDEWSSSPTRCDRARHSMVGRRRPPTAGSRRPDRRWRSGHGAQVAIAGSDGRGPAGAQSGEGSYPQCPQDQAPLPRTPTPFYRHLFLTARGALTIARIYLDLPPEGEPNLPLPTSIEMTPDASAVVTFHRNHWKGSPEYAGRMLEALSRTGQRDNTVVIFMSDHGEMLGDHGLTAKGCRFYEGAVRVPLIVSWPGRFRQGLIADGLAELTDLAPTLAELAGEADPARHHDYVRCEYYDALNVPAPGAGSPHPVLGHHVPRRAPQAGELPRPRLRRAVGPRTRSPGAHQPVGGAGRGHAACRAHPKKLRRRSPPATPAPTRSAVSESCHPQERHPGQSRRRGRCGRGAAVPPTGRTCTDSPTPAAPSRRSTKSTAPRPRSSSQPGDFPRHLMRDRVVLNLRDDTQFAMDATPCRNRPTSTRDF